MFKPEIKAHEMDDAVMDFENSILFFADAYNRHGPGSRQNSGANTPYDSPFSMTPASSGFATPALTPGSSAPSSRASSFAASQSRRPSFATRLGSLLRLTALPEARISEAYNNPFEESIVEQGGAWEDETEKEKRQRHQLEAWQIEASGVDRSVRILPGVKRLMDSIPTGKYAVATSGAKTYGMFITFIRPHMSLTVVSFPSSRMYEPCWYYTPSSNHHRRR